MHSFNKDHIFYSESGVPKYKYQKKPLNNRRDNNIVRKIERDLE